MDKVLDRANAIRTGDNVGMDRRQMQLVDDGRERNTYNGRDKYSERVDKFGHALKPSDTFGQLELQLQSLLEHEQPLVHVSPLLASYSLMDRCWMDRFLVHNRFHCELLNPYQRTVVIELFFHFHPHLKEIKLKIIKGNPAQD